MYVNCETCGDMGVVLRDVPFGHPDYDKTFPCPDCQTYDETRRNIIKRMSHLEAYEDKTFDTFMIMPDLPDSQQASLTNALMQAQRFAGDPDGWIVFQGECGVGKTHLAAAIAHETVASGKSTIFATVPDLLDHLRATYSPRSEVTYDQRFEEMRNVQVLVLDDLGSESATPWAQEKLYQLINHRHGSRRPTVITTNVEVSTMEERLASRILDKFLTRPVKIDAPDFRQSQGSHIARELDEISNLSLYKQMTFEEFQPLSKSLHESMGVVQHYAMHPDGWLFIYGTNGTGKTHLAAAVANYWNQYNKHSMGALMVSTADLLDYLRATFSSNSKVSLQSRFNHLKESALLILDNFSPSSRTNSQWSTDKLLQLLDYRYLARKPTVIVTTNQPTKEDNLGLSAFKSAYPDIFSRLQDQRLVRWIELNAQDYRKIAQA